MDLPTAGTIDVTSPVAYRAYQRNSSNQANIAITGTYTGTPTTIEASFNGGAYATIVASPAGGTFSGSLSAQAMGQGTLTVRFSNDTPTADTVAFVTIGDVFIVMGQSNHVGQAASFVAPSTVNFRAVELGLDNAWSEVVETDPSPFSDNTDAAYTPHQVAATAGNGSYFGALATQIMAAGVPVAFVPNAIGSTSISGWLPFSNHHSLTSAYGVSLTRAELVGDHKAMLWWQGENDAITGTTQSAYETSLNTLINAWYADTGKETVVYSINTANAGTTANNAAIRAAQRKVARSNANAIPGPRMEGAWSGNVHYTTTNDINEVANRAFNVLGAQFYGGTVVACGVGVTASAGMSATVDTDETDIVCGVAVTASVGLSAAIAISTVVNAGVGATSAIGNAASMSIATAISAGVGATLSVGGTATISIATAIACGAGQTASAGPAASISTGDEIVYTSAPAGSGYSPRRRENQMRPPAIQRNNR